MPTEITTKFEAITQSASEDFETKMIARNFVIGRYTAMLGTATSILVTPNQDEMLKQADEYNVKTNPKSSGLVTLLANQPVVKTVLHKEVNLSSKQVTYMFQKYDNTFVKLTMVLQ